MDLFRETFGLGPGGGIEFFKYSPQLECFVGFDQAYVRTEMSTNEFLLYLRQAAASDSYKIDEKLIGYFLQYKVVKQMKTLRKPTPSKIFRAPHYRVSLDTKKNLRTGTSQHELLFKLNKNKGAMVYYACPMIFDQTELYDLEVDLNTLRLVDVCSCPEDYSDNDTHYIYFNDINSDPIWCSEPVDGESDSPTEMAQKMWRVLQETQSAELSKGLYDLITDIDGYGLVKGTGVSKSPSDGFLDITSESLVIVKVRNPAWTEML